VTLPFPSYRFAVSLDPVDAYLPPGRPEEPAIATAGAFSDVTGLSGELEVLPHPEGGRNNFVHQLPVRHTWGRITLKKGVVRDRSLWTWFEAGLTGALGARRNGAIILWSHEGQPALTWEFRAGLAVKWIGPDLNAREGAIAIEALEIAHEGLTQVIHEAS
jgi:phage tail-like protein